MNAIRRLFHKAFVGGYWAVAYKRKGADFFTCLVNKKGTWNGDPFIIEKDSKLWIFTECYDTKKDIGRIACASIDNETYTEQKVIIPTKTHMSYPFVFEFNGKTFLLPENSQNGRLSLYEITDSFYEPIFVKDIFVDKDAVDCTICFTEQPILIGYSEKQKSLFYQLLNSDFSINGDKHYFSTSKSQRPAGSYLKNMIRPAQFSENKYGESIVFYRGYFKNNEYYEEQIDRAIKIQDIKFKTKVKAKKVHTYNETENYIVIDYFVEKFDLFRWYKMLRRKRHAKTNEKEN